MKFSSIMIGLFFTSIFLCPVSYGKEAEPSKLRDPISVQEKSKKPTFSDIFNFSPARASAENVEKMLKPRKKKPREVVVESAPVRKVQPNKRDADGKDEMLSVEATTGSGIAGADMQKINLQVQNVFKAQEALKVGQAQKATQLYDVQKNLETQRRILSTLEVSKTQPLVLNPNQSQEILRQEKLRSAQPVKSAEPINRS